MVFEYNFHPVLSSFPLPIICLAAAVELCFLASGRRALVECAFWLSMAFCLSVVGAFFSGYGGADFASRTFLVPEAEIVRHHVVGKVLIFTAPLLPLLAFVRLRARHGISGFAWAFRAVLACALVGVLFAGRLGGRLVFEFGAGVTAVPVGK